MSDRDNIERWTAAVARMGEVAALMDSAGYDADTADRVFDAVNAALSELDSAWRDCTPNPSNEEWAAAYAPAREAHIRYGQRSKRAQAIATVDSVSRDAREAGLLATALFERRP